jgi:alpha-maltose-1-phosphate synthase
MSEPSVLLSHPTGNENVRNALESFAENATLAEFWTTIAWNADSQWNRLLPAELRAQFLRRAYPQAPTERIKNVPWREIVRLGAHSSLLQRLLCSRERPFSIIGVQRHLDGKVARRLRALGPNAVYAYEGCALQTFREAKKLGITAIYELPSSYWYWARKLHSEEAERNPEFAGLLPTLVDSPGHRRCSSRKSTCPGPPRSRRLSRKLHSAAATN